MSQQYDVVVVGAGNGGLAAAAFAAKEGMKTLLLERHNIPGGCATSFRRGRFEFEAALHELAEFGPEENPGRIRKMYDELGLDVEMCPIEDCFHLIKLGQDGYSITMPNGREEFIRAMESIVPGSQESMRKFYELAEAAQKGIDFLEDDDGNYDMEVLKRDHPIFLQIAHKTVDEVLDEINMPPEAKVILSTYWGYLCVPTNECEFVLYATMVIEFIDRHAYIAKTRSHGMSLAFDAKIRERGGDIWYNTIVDEIILKDGKATGVRIGDRIINAKKVITCLNPHTVYTKMMNEANVPARALQLANAREIGVSAVTVYFGLNKSAEELGIKDYSTFCTVGEHSSKMFEEVFGKLDLQMIVGAVNCINVAIPDYSPKGTCIVWFTTLYRSGSWENVELQDYRKIKKAFAIGAAKFYEMIAGINILPYVEELEVATPVTFARYLNTPAGAIYGYQAYKWDNMIPRLFSQPKEQFIENLQFCGAAGARLDGYNSAYLTGMHAGKSAAKQVKEGK